MWQVAQARPLVWGSALSKRCLPAWALPLLTAPCASPTGSSVIEPSPPEQAASSSAHTMPEVDEPMLIFMNAMPPARAGPGASDDLAGEDPERTIHPTLRAMDE